MGSYFHQNFLGEINQKATVYIHPVSIVVEIDGKQNHSSREIGNHAFVKFAEILLFLLIINFAMDTECFALMPVRMLARVGREAQTGKILQRQGVMSASMNTALLR